MNKKLNEIYKTGTRIKLIEMKDREFPLSSGTKGYVLFVDNNSLLHMCWDNNCITPLDLEKDKFEIIGNQAM